MRFLNSLRQRLRISARVHLRLGLTPAECNVLDGLIQNLTNKEIANRLNITDRTVKFHVSNLLRKFGKTRRSELVFLFYPRRGSTAMRFALRRVDRARKWLVRMLTFENGEGKN